MVRLSYSLLAAMMVAASVAQAQSDINWPFSSKGNGANKINAYGSRMKAQSQSIYDATAGVYVVEDSSNYRYGGNRGGDAAHTPLSDYSDMYMVSGGAFGKLLQTATVYDAFDNKLTEITQRINISGGFDNNSKSQYTYNAAHLQITDTTYLWQNVWEPYSVRVSTYSMSGKRTRYAQYLKSNTWDFVPRWQQDYVYDGNDSLIEVITLQRSTTTLQNYNRQQYTYNAAGKIIGTKYQEWDGAAWKTVSEAYWHINAQGDDDTLWALELNTTTMQLDTVRKGFAIFDANHNSIEVRNEEYDYSLSAFVRTDSVLNTYDANNNVTERLYYGFDKLAQMYKAPLRETFLYNVFAQRTERRVDYWNSTGWQPGDRLWRYYYEGFFPAGVGQLKQQGGALKIYPVPANNILNVAVEWNDKQNYTLTIADMQGRVVLQSNNNNAAQVLDIAALPAGAYNIVLKGAKGGLQHSKFTVVR